MSRQLKATLRLLDITAHPPCSTHGRSLFVNLPATPQPVSLVKDGNMAYCKVRETQLFLQSNGRCDSGNPEI